MIENLGAIVSLYACYKNMYEEDMRFKNALLSVYSHIICLLLKAEHVFRRRGMYLAPYQLEAAADLLGSKLFLRFIWSTFESEFQENLNKMSRLLVNLQQETTLVHRKTVQGALTNIKLLTQAQFSRTSNDVRNEIMNWLSPLDTASRLIEISQRRIEGTGDWIFRDENFRSWLSPQGSPVLWINGNPGAGKTVLSSLVINYLQGQKTTGQVVAFYFCDKMDGTRTDCTSLLNTLIAQICTQSPTIPKPLVEAFDHARAYGRRQLSLSDNPASLLRTMLSELESLRVIIDGLDELKDATEIFKLLRDHSDPPSKVHISVLSRDLPTMRAELEGYPMITLDAPRMRADIYLSVSKAAGNLRLEDTVSTQTIINRVTERANGKFLWSHLAMKSLLQAVSPSHLAILIQEVPQGLSAIYTEYLRGLKRHDSYAQDVAAKLLRLVCCSKRSLSWAELQCALSETWTAGKPTTTFAPLRQVIIELGQPLVIYQYEQDLFRFEHLSVRDYLVNSTNRELIPEELRNFLVEEDTASRELAYLCLSYLSHEGGTEGPLSTYACRFWCEHVIEARWDAALQDAVCHFLSDRDRRQAWLDGFLLNNGNGFSLHMVMRIRNKLNLWMVRQYQHSQDKIVHPFLDWAVDFIEIMLRDDTDQGNFVVPSMSHFEKLMVVRDLSRHLRFSNQLIFAVSKLEDHFKDHDYSGGHPRPIWIYNALGILYDQLGKAAHSIALHKTALAMQEAMFGAHHIETAWTINELGRMNRHIGDFAESITHHERSLVILRTALPAEHMEIIWTENTLARALRKHGEPAKALDLHTKAYAVCSRLLGDTHTHTLWVMGDIAQCYRALGKLDEAVKYYRLALEGRIGTLGREHADTLWSMNDLGVALAEQGEHAEAMKLQQHALETQERVLGLNHKYTEWTRKVLNDLTI